MTDEEKQAAYEKQRTEWTESRRVNIRKLEAERLKKLQESIEGSVEDTL